MRPMGKGCGSGSLAIGRRSSLSHLPRPAPGRRKSQGQSAPPNRVVRFSSRPRLRLERLRPIWHQNQDRVLGHILVCFLAYVLWKSLAQWMRHSGLGDAPRPFLEEFAKIKSGDVVLPTKSASGARGPECRLRCVTEPDAAQKVLLGRLGLRLPRRLRQRAPAVEM